MQVFGLGFAAIGLPFGWPKLEKWHPAKTIGLLHFYVHWFQFHPWPPVIVGKTFLFGR